MKKIFVPKDAWRYSRGHLDWQLALLRWKTWGFLYLEKNSNSSPWLTRVQRAALWPGSSGLLPLLTHPLSSPHLRLSPWLSFHSPSELQSLSSPLPVRVSMSESSQLLILQSMPPPQGLTLASLCQGALPSVWFRLEQGICIGYRIADNSR